MRTQPIGLVSTLILLMGLVLTGGGCASDQAVMAQANNFQGELAPAVVNDPELAGYLQAVGERIITTARELHQQKYGPDAHFKEDSQWMFSDKMKFHFVNSKTLNAFTTGGEHMYIYTELFIQCKTEDELAAVMAHEYAHVYGRHVQKGMNRQMGIVGATTVAGVAGSFLGGDKYGQLYGSAGAGLVGATAQFVGMGYTRKDEGEADKVGFDIYVRSGWDPNRFGDFFQHMIDLGLDTGNEMLSDHPSLKNRVANAKKWASELPASASSWKKAPVADGAKFEALKGRAKQIGTTMPNDQSLANSQKILQAMPRSCLTPAVPADQKRARADLVRMTQQKQAAAQAR